MCMIMYKSAKIAFKTTSGPANSHKSALIIIETVQ